MAAELRTIAIGVDDKHPIATARHVENELVELIRDGWKVVTSFAASNTVYFILTREE